MSRMSSYQDDNGMEEEHGQGLTYQQDCHIAHKLLPK